MEKYKDINVKKILKDQTYSVIAELAAAVCVLAACWIYFYKGYYRSVSYTHLDVYKRQVYDAEGIQPTSASGMTGRLSYRFTVVPAAVP